MGFLPESEASRQQEKQWDLGKQEPPAPGHGHTWEMGKEEERERQWLRRQKEREWGCTWLGWRG